MTYKWEWSNKLQCEMASPVDKDGYRFLLTVSPSGEYTVVKFLVKNSFNIPFSQARPNLVTKGWAETVELGKEKAELAFERFTGIKREPEVIQEEPIIVESTKPEFASAEVTEVIDRDNLVISFEAAEDKIKMTLLDSDLGEKGVKIKYTTNGKPVQSNSRNYTEPVLVEPGATIILKKFIGDATVEKTVVAEV